jgi:hypothetical protein
MKRGIVICGLACLLFGCSQEVQTGRIVKCKQCGKVMENSISVIKVPTRAAKKYRVSYQSSLCQSCGDERVSYNVSRQCEYCGKVYSTETEYATRRANRRDRTTTEGYCNSTCQRKKEAYNAVDNASEKVGDGIGRISRGIADGILKHMR